MNLEIHHLFRAPGHDYFGRHGMAPDCHGIEECAALDLVAGRGVIGDRFFDYKENYKGQMTLIDLTIIDEVRRFCDDPYLSSSAFRRNGVVSGLDLNSLIGIRFSIGDILLQGTEECRPCYWMDAACGKAGTEQLMKGHGGLRCKILSGGTLRLGNQVCRVDC